MAIKNYAIIDHAGSVGACKALYKRAFAQAKGFEKVFTLKNICQQYSPYAREITNKMKYFHRYNRTPQHVFIVCSSQFDPKAQFIANIWESRNIQVSFVEEEAPKKAATPDISPARRCAMVWSQAIGWQFSAPLFKDPQTEQIDMYTARQDMMNESGSYAAKRTTNPQTYRDAFRNVASEDECWEFTRYMQYLKKNNLLAEFLEPGWVLCPHCGKPIREGSTCTYCDTHTNQKFYIKGYEFETDEFSDIKDFDFNILQEFAEGYSDCDDREDRFFDDSFVDEVPFDL